MEFKPKIKEKTWNPKLESEIFEFWQKEKLFKFDKKNKKPVFSIDTPPPYVNTPIHVGQAYTYTIQDIIARFKRMQGFNVLFPMGLDKNGLPIEIQAEKTFKISIINTSREEFIKKCKKLIEESGDASLDSFKKLGLSVNSWKDEYALGGKYGTDDPEYRKLSQETFIHFWNKGLVYEDDKATNYCSECRTTISDAEVEYEEVKTYLYYVKFKVKETGEEVTIATTRPELLGSCKIILFNPSDQRYSMLEGMHATVPIFHQQVEIKSHPYAKPDFGSGLVMMCSYGDQTDVRVFRELNLSPVYSIDATGRMTENAKQYKGLKVAEARQRIVEDLKKMNLLEKEEITDHRQPICWRTKNPIEFIPMKELYLKQVDFKEELMKIANEIKFFPTEHRQILIDWINSVTIDWVLSRRRFYGTEIPLWYCKKCGTTVVPEPGKYYQPWKENPPVKKCKKCGSTEFRGEERIFDTWFDSSSSVLYILGYLWDKEFFKKNFPASLRPQGKEIVRNWLYFTLLKVYHQFKKKAFDSCWIHMHVTDDKGEKMSKSLGNVIDPQDVLKKYGAEAFRIWTCLEGDISRGDIRCSFQRIEGTSKFLTKLWNIARFISSFPIPKKAKLTKTDEWILAEFSKLAEDVKKKYENYEFYEAATAIRDFAWNIFAANYIEMVKVRAYGVNFRKEEQEAAWYTLHECLKNLLLLLSPIVPFITEQLWLELYGNKSINAEKYPEMKMKSKLTGLTQKLLEFNSYVWDTKKKRGISLKEEIEIDLPVDLEDFKKDLVAMHKIKS